MTAQTIRPAEPSNRHAYGDERNWEELKFNGRNICDCRKAALLRLCSVWLWSIIASFTAGSLYYKPC